MKDHKYNLLKMTEEYLLENGWRDAADQFPQDGERVVTCYLGVYENRECTFWRDAGGNPHFGLPNEADGKGSQPARLWKPIQSNAEQDRGGSR